MSVHLTCSPRVVVESTLCCMVWLCCMVLCVCCMVWCAVRVERAQSSCTRCTARSRAWRFIGHCTRCTWSISCLSEAAACVVEFVPVAPLLTSGTSQTPRTHMWHTRFVRHSSPRWRAHRWILAKWTHPCCPSLNSSTRHLTMLYSKSSSITRAPKVLWASNQSPKSSTLPRGARVWRFFKVFR